VNGKRVCTGGGLALLAALTTSSALAQDDAGPPVPPATGEVTAPPPPPPLRSGESLEPEVRILRTPRETVYEYRRNGQLFLVRVQPQFGPVYHFVDIDGDGELDFRPGDPLQTNVHQWLLFRW
jgi:hypothetical protein